MTCSFSRRTTGSSSRDRVASQRQRNPIARVYSTTVRHNFGTAASGGEVLSLSMRAIVLSLLVVAGCDGVFGLTRTIADAAAEDGPIDAPDAPIDSPIDSDN